MKIGVTGCCGYLGSTLLIKLLQEGYSVVGVDSCRYNNESSLFPVIGDSNFVFHHEDVRHHDKVAEILKDCDVIVALAGLVGATACDNMYRCAISTNYRAMADFVPLLRDDQKLIYANTNSGYRSGGIDFCTEESEIQPFSHYAKTKMWGEKFALKHSNSVSLRFATIFGASIRPRFDLLVNFLVRELYLKSSATIFEPNFRRNYIHVLDACSAIIKMMKEPHVGVYNVGNDALNCNKIDLVNIIGRIMVENGFIKGYDVEIGEGSDPDQRDYIVSSLKIRNLGFRAIHGFEKGVIEVAKMSSMLRHENFNVRYSNGVTRAYRRRRYGEFRQRIKIPGEDKYKVIPLEELRNRYWEAVKRRNNNKRS